MCRRTLPALVTLIVVQLLSVGPLRAEDNQGRVSDPSGVAPLAPTKIDFSPPHTPALPSPRMAEASGVPATGVRGFRSQAVEEKPRPPRRTPLLIGLYVSQGILQGLDAQASLRAFHSGAHEGNPLVSAFASQPGALIAFKAGVTTGTIFGIDGLYKAHPRLALITLTAINGGYACLVARNYRSFPPH